MKEKKFAIFQLSMTDYHLVGLVTDRDIRDATPSIFHTEEYSDDLKKPIAYNHENRIITGHPLDFVEEIAAVFYENKISCLPIVKEKKLVGIITETDLLQSFVELTGVNQAWFTN